MKRYVLSLSSLVAVEGLYICLDIKDFRVKSDIIYLRSTQASLATSEIEKRSEWLRKPWYTRLVTKVPEPPLKSILKQLEIHS